MGDEGAAARDQLSAVNEQPDFREPLEQLITIIQRRQSYKNLGKLLERLVRVSDTPEAIERAELDHAAHLARFEDNLSGAREALENALSHAPESASLWYALETVAGKLRDPELRQRALRARVDLTQHSTWRALLAIDLGKLAAQTEDIDLAVGTLQKAVDQASPATFIAARALEHLAEQEGRTDLLASALETQATLIERALEDSSALDSFGVPGYRRTEAQLAQCWLGAAEAHRSRGDVALATGLLDKALARFKTDPTILHARLNAAEVAGDTRTAAELSRTALDQGVTGPLAAALWLRVAEAAASDGDGAGALAAVKSALQEDPACIPARALELDLLSGGMDGAALAATFEETAEQLPSKEGKARYYLMAANAWARLANDVQGAKAALSQAGLFGTSPSTVARVARLLATTTDDLTWYDDATKRLIAAGAGPQEKLSLWYELARLRMLRGDAAGAKEAVAALSELPDGDWLGSTLHSYVLPLVSTTQGQASPGLGSDAEALEKLALVDTDAATVSALRVAITLRKARAGAIDAAAKLLEEIQGDEPQGLLVSMGLAETLKRRGEGSAAAAVLAECASGQTNDTLAASLSLQAGMTYWQGGDRKAAVECFTHAHEREPDAGGLMLSWALRAVEPNDLNARRQALDTASAEDPVLALERFGLEVYRGGATREAVEALESVGTKAPGELREAATLAKALTANADDAGHLDALESLAALGGEAPMLALAAEHLMELEVARKGQLDPVKLERTAAGWAAQDPSLVAAMEWLAAATASNDHGREVLARRAIAQRLDPALGSTIEASASLLSALVGNEQEPLLASSESAARLANLELSLPGCDPRRRVSALLNVGDVLGDDSAALCRALGGYNQLSLGNAEQALTTFRSVVEAFPEEVIGWEGMRRAALETGDRTAAAEACAALGDATSDDAEGAQFWEEAAMILMDELDDPERGEFALARAVERDVGRFAAFDRLFRIVRARKDGPRLLELVAKRLDVAEDPAELAKLFWERARVLRQTGDHQGALSALENVTMLETDHVGALALAGEIYLSTQQFPEAAAKLAKLATLDEAPARQRLMSGIAAVDIYEKRLRDNEAALAVLQGLHSAGLSTLPVRERLAKVAARCKDWASSTQVLEQLMTERDSAEGRIEAARLAMVIHRDQLARPGGAAKAVSCLLSEAPDDGEALELVLSDILEDHETIEFLERGQTQLIAALMAEPLDAERLDRLARVASKLEDAPLRQAALGSLVAVGEGTRDIDRELAELDQRVTHVPQMAIGSEVLPELADAEDAGAIPELMALMAPTLAEALGPNLASFSVTRRHKVSPRAGLPLRNEVAAWAGALGIGEFDLYVGGPADDGVFGVSGETPSLIVGPAVAAPLNAQHRASVARELFALRRGTSILRHREATDVAALIVAAARVVEVNIPSPEYAMLGEFTRLLSKDTPRKLKRTLASLAQSIVDSAEDPVMWYRAATSSLDRMATLAAGDVSWVLLESGATRGRLGASIEAQRRAARLLSFVLSPSYLALRQKLGMGVR
jgi:lipopolysaccharide biosynthesis regulator YciM